MECLKKTLPMKRSSVVFVFILFLAVTFSARGQVAPSATGRKLTVKAGGEASMFQPDYTGLGYAWTSSQHLYGIGAYVDADFSRWIQIEAEGRWLHWNQLNSVEENTYMIGPRVPIVEYKRLTPYGKFLFGWSSAQWLTGRAPALAYGGGVDYRLNKRLTLRAFDFEYQQWRVNPSLHPYGGSVGMSYRVY
jgi:hypothetical protein